MAGIDMPETTSGNMDTSPRITFTARKSLDDDGTVVLNDKKMEKYMKKHYSDWQTAFHMVPLMFDTPKQKRDLGKIQGDEAEWHVYRLLHDLGNDIGEPMFVIHGFKYEEDNGNKPETDFVIVSKKHGIIIMEVKAIKGESSQNLPDRFEKAEDQIDRVRKYLKDKVPDASTAMANKLAFVVMPNYPQPEDKNGCFREDCQDDASFRAWWEKNIGCTSPLDMTEEQYKSLLYRLIERRSTGKPLGKQIDDTISDDMALCLTRDEKDKDKKKKKETADALLFDRQQLALLSDLSPRHQLITGPAGSGKTTILLRKVQDLDADISRNGKNEKILVLCYDRALREKLTDYLRNCCSVTVKTFDSMRYHIDEVSWIPNQCVIAIEDLHHLHGFTFDHIFVDEGQDIFGGRPNQTPSETELIKYIQSKSEGKFHWVFFDNEQLVHFGATGLSKEDLDKAHKLREVYRMTGSTFEQFKKYLSDPEKCTIAHEIKGAPIDWDKMDQESDPADPEAACVYITKHVKRLLKNKVCGKDICVLVRNKEIADSISKSIRLMRNEFQCQNAEASMANPVDSAIIVDSIRRFKGLETKVLILYNPADPRDTKLRELLNTALSRSYCLVIVIAPEQAVLSLKSDVGMTYQPASFEDF